MKKKKVVFISDYEIINGSHNLLKSIYCVDPEDKERGYLDNIVEQAQKERNETI